MRYAASDNRTFVRVRPRLIAAAVSLAFGAAHAASVNWVPDADGQWSVPGNWSGNALPSAGDGVTISVGGVTVRTITYNASAGDSTVATFTSDENLLVSGGALTVSGNYTNNAGTQLTGGTLKLNGTSSTNTLTQSSGTLSGTGVVTVGGVASLSGGTQTGTGTTILSGGGSINGNIGLDEGRTLRIGNGINPSTVDWTGGSINLNAGGTGNAQAGILSTAVGGVLNATSNNLITANNFGGVEDGSSARFDNAGTFRKSAGTGSTLVQVQFNNTGTVQVQSGTVNLSGGGTHTGSFDVSTGATLQFGGGAHTVNGALAPGAGRLLVTGGTVNTTGTISAAAAELAISGGTLTADGPVNVGALTQSSGTLSGTGVVTVGGVASLSGGTQTGTGTTILSGGGSINGSIALDEGRTLRIGNGINPGTVEWTGGSINLNAGGTANAQAGILSTAVGGVLNATSNNLIHANNFGGVEDGSSARFDNAGTFRKSGGTGTTFVQVQFNNTGTVDVQTGTIALINDSVHDGTLTVASGATLQFSSGTHRLINATASGAGQVHLSAGTMVVEVADSAVIGSAFAQSGGTVSGTGVVTVSGAASLSGGQQRGTGTTILAGGGNISDLSLDEGRTLRIGNGIDPSTVDWTGGSINLNASGTGNAQAGILATAVGGVLNATSNNLITANNFGGVEDGSSARFDNAGTFRKSAGAGTTTVSVQFDNTGTAEVQSGTLSFSNVAQHVGSTLTGGTWIADNGTLAFTTGSNITTNQANVVLSGASSAFARIDTLADNQGAFTVRNGRTFSTAGALANSGTVTAGAGGTLNLTGAVTNTGTLATSGVMNASALITGTGVVQINPGGQLNLGGASSAGTLINNGTTSTALNLGAHDITVSGDYQNANFGSGNSFARRSNVAGTGQILSSNPNAAQQQGLSGDIVGGSTSAGVVVMDFGNVHAGQTVTLSYQITNAAGGPALRGAIQTAAGAGNITDPRLSGTGVTAGNFDPIAAGGASGPFEVTFQAGTVAGSAGLAGQQVAIVNNFDNTNAQILTFTGGVVYAFAQPSAATPSPVAFGNVRLGSSATQALTIANTSVAPAGFQESLNASISTASPGITASGSFSGLAQGATNSSSLVVGIDTGSVGVKSGTATIALQSDGAGSSGLGITDLAAQTVAVSGTVWRTAQASPATPNPIVFEAARVGDVRTRELTINNIAPNDGFSEGLRAAIGGATGNLSASGTTGVIAAGANGGGMNVTLDTSAAGARSGTATISLFSNGAGTSGLTEIGIGTQTVNASGNVYQVAQPTLASNTITFTNRHVGASAAQALSITNAAAAPAGFQEALNASFSATTGAATATGNIAGLGQGESNTTSLVVGIDTSSAGAKSGTATLALQSDGAGTSGLGTLNLASQVVNVSGNVYRLAEALISSPLDFGNVLVGSGPVTRAVTISNTAIADGFSEALNASFGTLTNTGAGNLSTAGSVSLLGPGQTDNTSMLVTLTPTAQGAVQASVQILLASDGTGTSGLGITALPSQSITLNGLITANAGVLAQASAVAPNPVNFGKFRVGGAAPAEQTLTIQNVATGPAEGLNASIATTSTGFTATGAFTGLAPQATDNTSLRVGFTDTATAGAKSNTATITLASDGSFNSGVATPLPSQTVSMSAEVYRLAEAGVAPSPVAFANARVGDSRTQALTISNTAAADGFSEGLRAAAGGTSGSVSASGSTGLIAAGASSDALSVTLDTSSAGAKSGTVTVALQSDGAGTSGFSALDIGTQTVNVSGNVYQLAAGTLNTAPLSFGTVQVGQSVSQTLSITNSAVGPAGFVEDLNARFGAASGTGAGAISGSGQIAGLAAGGTDASSMVVTVDTSSAQTINGSIAVNFFSAGAVNGVSNGLGEVGVGSAAYGVSGVIEATGTVINQASPLLNTPVVNLGNVRIGSAEPSAFVSVTNQATTAPQAALNAAISAAVPITASGSFDLLAPGATDATSLRVGMNTSSAGAVNGTATVSFVSDASNVGGCAPNCQLTLASQSVSVTGAVYRLANPVLSTASVTLAARVGDAAPAAAISVSNSSPDIYTEGLKASLGSAPAGFSAGGIIGNLAAGGTDASSLSVRLDTSAAGTFSGPLDVTFTSTGEGTTGAPDIAVGAGAVALSGKVYTAAVAQVVPTVIDFGIMHKGEAIATRNVAVSNIAAVSALNDVLRGSFGGAAGPFTAAGNLGAGVAAGATDASSFTVALDTAQTGVFNGTATASLSSHNADLADLALAPVDVTLLAQVNDFANAALVKQGGGGVFSGSGLTYTLDLGSILFGTGLHSVSLAVLNDVLGPADLLSGEFDLGLNDDFVLSGFDPFSDLGAGDFKEGLIAALDTDLLALGTYVDTIVLRSVGHNASGYREALQDITLILRASIIERTGTVPEPGTLALVLLGMLALMRRMRRVAR